MTRFLVLVALAILSVVAPPVAAEMLFGSADYGIHTVKHRARPIQLFVWYPAEVESGAKPLEYGDYIRLSDITIVPWKQTAEEKQATVDAYVAGSQEPEKIQAILDVLLAMPTKAVKNAPAAEGKFPLLIVGSGAIRSGEGVHGRIAGVARPREDGDAELVPLLSAPRCYNCAVSRGVKFNVHQSRPVQAQLNGRPRPRDSDRGGSEPALQNVRLTARPHRRRL